MANFTKVTRATTFGLNIQQMKSSQIGERLSLGKISFGFDRKHKKSSTLRAQFFSEPKNIRFTNKQYKESSRKLNEIFKNNIKKKMSEYKADRKMKTTLDEWGKKRSHYTSFQDSKNERLNTSVVSRGFRASSISNKPKKFKN